MLVNGGRKTGIYLMFFVPLTKLGLKSMKRRKNYLIITLLGANKYRIF
jgi:hypothetical protein